MKKLFVRIGGGLGNQMMNYALALSLVEVHGAQMIIDTSEFKLIPGRKYGLLNFTGPAATEHAGLFRSVLFFVARCSQRFGLGWCRLVLAMFGYRLFAARDAIDFLPVYRRLKSELPNNAYLSGCYGFVAYMPSRKTLRAEFMLREALNDANMRIRERIEKANVLSVAVHVRRTDYLLAKNGTPVLNPVYYCRAISKMRELVGSEPTWFFFSDDIPWCREYFVDLPNAVFVTGNDRLPWVDIHLMSKCRHHIIANSTFSWWGAMLAADGGHVICPDKWFNPVEESVCTTLSPDWLRL